MLSKNAKGYSEEELPSDKRFRANLADAFLSGQLTGQRACSLFRDAKASGSRHIDDLGHLPKHQQNHNSSLKRKLLKGTEWPRLYWAPIRIWCKKKQSIVTEELPFILPHEFVFQLCEKGDPSIFKLNLQPDDEEHLRYAAAHMDLPDHTPLLVLGLWSDAVPCNWDRSESIDLVVLNCPSLPGHYQKLRVPLFCCKKGFQAKQQTMDDCLAILKYSFEALALGLCPSKRHDGSDFRGRQDVHRQKRANSTCPRAVLTQIRGDWKMLKELFSLPQHNEVGGICFKCACDPQTMRQVSLSASWRQEDYNDWSFMRRFLNEGRPISPIFGTPFFKPSIIRLDWLHVVDLGVAADCAGNILWQVQFRLPGNNISQRLKALFLELREFYGQSSPDQLQTLTETMIRKNATSAPKLKAKGAEVRKLVTFLVQIANRYLNDPAKPEDEAQRTCVRHLLECYEALTVEPYTKEHLMLSGRLFASQAVAIEAYFGDGVTWRTKPKMHMFMHLIESDTNPATIWCYRDEDFGGSAATAVRSKGRWNTAPSSSQQVFDKFRAKHDFPCVV